MEGRTMRCKACDRILEESEMIKKDSNGDFLDLCGVCLSAVASAGIDSETMEYYQYEVFTDEDKYDTLY
jgi:hypothetical protein